MAVVTFILILTTFVVPSYQFVTSRRFCATKERHAFLMTSTAILPTKDSDTLTIRVAIADELPRCAGFLSKNMYPEKIPRAQANELQRLELADLRSRYGMSSGRQVVPSVFIVAVEEEEIIGCVGLDSQYFDLAKQKFKQIKVNKALDPEKIVALVLSNLAVRRDKRNQKIAQKLLLACENYIRDSEKYNYKEIYLLVASENTIAQKLYKKQNYKLIFEDADATCVVSGDYNLQTLMIKNYCFKKILSSSSSINPFEKLSEIVGGLFKK